MQCARHLKLGGFPLAGSCKANIGNEVVSNIDEAERKPSSIEYLAKGPKWTCNSVVKVQVCIMFKKQKKSWEECEVKESGRECDGMHIVWCVTTPPH